MPTPAAAPPATSRVEIVVGGVLTGIGALILVTRIGSIPAFIVEIVVGFTSVKDFWPMVGGSLLLAAGVYCLVRGRRGVRRHRQFVARVEAVHAREEEQRRQHGSTGVSAPVEVQTFRMPKPL